MTAKSSWELITGFIRLLSHVSDERAIAPFLSIDTRTERCNLLAKVTHITSSIQLSS